MAKRKISRDEIGRATRARIAEEHQCAKCGCDVSVPFELHWDKGDMCNQCLPIALEEKNAEIERLRELLREARDAMLRRGAYLHTSPHRLAEEIRKVLGKR